MNARLSSLLVAGSVVLAGIQSGSLQGAVPAVDASGSVALLKAAAFMPVADSGSVLHLAIPGYQGVPRLQVLANPNRVVIDLPGVDRGTGLAKKDISRLTSPLVVRWRVAQFSFNPDVTRVVLEVVPGTRAEVTTAGDGVDIQLRPGQGQVQAHVGSAAPVQTAAAEPLPALPVQEALPAATVVAAPEPILAAVPTPAPTPMPIVVSAPASEPVAAPAPAFVPEPVAAPAAAPEPVVAPAAAPEPIIAPVAALAPVTAPIPAAVPAPVPVVVPAAEPAAAPLAIPVAAASKAAPEKLAPLPGLNQPFQTLPSLAVNALLPATLQEVPAAPRKELRGGKTLGDSGTRYSGTRMTIDVVGTDITSFLRIIADTAHLNLIVDQDVQGIYSFKFTDAPWDQVLDVILKHAGLGKEVSNGIIRVAKVEKLQKEEEDRKRLEDAKALAGETMSITRPLSFAKAGEAKGVIEKMLTKRGSLIIDDRTNTLIITDLPRNLPVLDDLIATLDVQIQQVQIEARVVEATKNWEQAFGVKWPTSNTGSTKLTVDGKDAAWGSYNGPSWNSINNLSNGTGNSVAAAYSGGKDGVTSLQNPAGELWLSFLSNRMSINVVLQALESQGVVKVVSSPKVVTQNNKKAKVLSGQRIPYATQQTGSTSGAITTSFADANLSLEVTPQITNDGTILMDIHVTKDDADFSNTVQGTPTITQKLVETQVLVKDGGTAIMGGVYKNTNSQQTTGVPFLSKLPLIGFLFRSKDNIDKNDELLVFITPRILKN